jgi:DeoR/GlpR family transcriptional regulator of sugar metabolism
MRATKFVNEGDTLILDTGTSIFEFAKALTKFKSLTAITIDLNIASYLERNTDFDVIVVGGLLRKGFSCTLGPKALEFMDALNADKAVLSSNSFNLQNGFMTPNVSHVELKKEMIKKSNERIMLMDSSKVNTISLYTFAELKDIDVLITDSKIDEKIIKKIKKANKNLEVGVVR